MDGNRAKEGINKIWQNRGYERFVQDVYKVLNENNGLKNVVVQHDVTDFGLARKLE